MKIKKTKIHGDCTMEISLETDGQESVNKKFLRTLFGEEVLDDDSDLGIQEETVVLYDNAGIPSIMRKISRLTNRELFGGADKPHPAFVIDGEVYDEIYISVYPNTAINGKPYSLPYAKAWTDITNDEAAKACFSKGEGWHLMTAAEWGLVANICRKNGTFPHGNTNSGRYYTSLLKEEGMPEVDKEISKVCNGTLTGSGPVTWTHNYQSDGIHDLCGNVSEMIRGMRVRNGALEVAKDNDAAMDIDLTRDGDAWVAAKDDAGKEIYFDIFFESRYSNITVTTKKSDHGFSGLFSWEDVKFDCESEQLKELALYSEEPRACCRVDSTKREYLAARGGGWLDGVRAGVFSLELDHPRDISNKYLGFRSAYFRKRKK